MTDTRPTYVVGSPGPLRDRVTGALRSLSPRSFDGVDPFVDAGPRPGITYLVFAGMSGDAVLRALDHMAVGRGEWTPVIVREEGGDPVVRTLSLGYPHPLEEAASSTAVDRSGTLLELRAVLSRIARTRHDINNPLTSALAETQLMLMDAREDELRSSLETVLTQLRRIRDLVADTVPLRPLD